VHWINIINKYTHICLWCWMNAHTYTYSVHKTKLLKRSHGTIGKFKLWIEKTFFTLAMWLLVVL
jgi:hypothetical protein